MVNQSPIKEIYHSTRISDGIDMKLRPVTKLEKRKNATSKKFDKDGILENCDVISNFLIYGQFRAILKLDSRGIVCKFYIYIKSNFLFYKNWRQNKKISNTAVTLLLWVKVLVLFLLKSAIFFSKNADISKIKRDLVLKGIFCDTTYVCVLTYQISGFWYNCNWVLGRSGFRQVLDKV